MHWTQTGDVRTTRTDLNPAKDGVEPADDVERLGTTEHVESGRRNNASTEGRDSELETSNAAFYLSAYGAMQILRAGKA